MGSRRLAVLERQLEMDSYTMILVYPLSSDWSLISIHYFLPYQPQTRWVYRVDIQSETNRKRFRVVNIPYTLRPPESANYVNLLIY